MGDMKKINDDELTKVSGGIKRSVPMRPMCPYCGGPEEFDSNQWGDANIKVLEGEKHGQRLNVLWFYCKRHLRKFYIDADNIFYNDNYIEV